MAAAIAPASRSASSRPPTRTSKWTFHGSASRSRPRKCSSSRSSTTVVSMDPAWAWRGPIAAEPRNADRRTAGRGAASAARLRERDAPLIFRDRVGDLRAGGYLELGEDLAQVILDRARADEQPR